MTHSHMQPHRLIALARLFEQSSLPRPKPTRRGLQGFGGLRNGRGAFLVGGVDGLSGVLFDKMQEKTIYRLIIYIVLYYTNYQL